MNHYTQYLSYASLSLDEQRLIDSAEESTRIIPESKRGDYRLVCHRNAAMQIFHAEFVNHKTQEGRSHFAECISCQR